MWKSSKCRGLSQSSTLRSWTPWFSDLASTKWRFFQILWKGHVTMSQSGIWGFMSSMSCSILVFHGFSSYFPECFLWPHPTCFRRMLEKKDKPRPSVKELIDDPYVQATTWSNCCMVSGLLHILWPFSIFQQYLSFPVISSHLGFVDVWDCIHTISVRHKPATGQSFLDEYLQSRPPDLFTRAATPCTWPCLVSSCDNSTWPGQSAAASRTSTGPRDPAMLAQSTGLCLALRIFEGMQNDPSLFL